jgi:hypothetical protein
MKDKKIYDSDKLFKETNEIIGMMEDVFGHRVTQYSPKDTNKLKNKVSQPMSDREKEEFVATVEPLMIKKSVVPKGKDKNLNSFIDIDTRTKKSDFDQTIDLDDYKKTTRIVFKKKDSDKKEKPDSKNNK